MGRQLRLELRRPQAFRRESFIVSPANEAAVRAIDASPDWRDGALALIGPEGSGKSHLARAWAAKAGARVLAPGEAISTLAVGHLQGRAVLLEDADRGAADEGLFHLINRAAAGDGSLLLTARAAPSAWPTALPDLRSRLNALPVAELPPPDDAILTGVLEKMFRERNIKPAEDLIPYLLRRIERSIPRAAEIVARLDETADAEHRAVSRALARQILEIDGESRDLFD